ncbi:MAG: DUF1801 domain-containing protein [Planctomycetota bacterium]
MAKSLCLRPKEENDMATPDAKSPKEYIDSLPQDRRGTIKKLRALIRKNLPKGYKEEMRWGMICYEVPLSVCPNTYNGQPLMYAAIAAQKKHYGVYLCGMYAIPTIQKTLVRKWKNRGTRLDMGKSCIRLSSWDDCEQDLIAEAIAAVPIEQFIEVSSTPSKSKRKAEKNE